MGRKTDVGHGGCKDVKCVLCLRYSASQIHNAGSSAKTLKLYTVGDEEHNVRRAAAPTGRVLTVSKGLSFLETLANNNKDVNT